MTNFKQLSVIVYASQKIRYFSQFHKNRNEEKSALGTHTASVLKTGKKK